MKIAEFQLPDGRIAQFEVDDNFTDEQAQTLIPQLAQQAAQDNPIQPENTAQPETAQKQPEKDFLDQLHNFAGRTNRVALNNLVALPSLALQGAHALNPMNAIGDALIESTTGQQAPEVPTLLDYANKLMDFAQVPAPQTQAERITDATMGGLIGGAPFGVVPAVSGALGSRVQQSAQESGVGPLASLALGVGTGALSGAGLNYAGQGIRNIINPANEQAVTNVMRGAASDPDLAAANIQAAPQGVSIPTAGEVGGDTGLIALQNRIQRTNPSSALTDAYQEQNAARQGLMDQLAGTPEELGKKVQERSAVTGPMREQAFDSYTQDVRVPKTQYQAHKANIKSGLESFKGSDFKNQKTQDQLVQHVKSLGFDVQDQASKTGKSTVYTASKTDPVTGQVNSFQFRVGNNAIPKSAQGNYIDLVGDKNGLNKLADQLAQAEPLKPDVNLNYAKGIVNRTLESPKVNNSDVRDAMHTVRDSIVTAMKSNDPAYAYELRKSMANDVSKALSTKAGGAPIDDPKKYQRLAAGMTKDILDSIDDQIENAAPGYRAYMDKYAEMSKPITEMEALQDIRDKITKANIDSKGTQGMSLARLNSIIENDESMKKAIGDPAWQSLAALRDDLQRSSVLGSVKAAGSTTPSDLIGRAITRIGPVRSLFDAEGARSALDQRIAEVLANAPDSVAFLKGKTSGDIRKAAGAKSALAALAGSAGN